VSSRLRSRGAGSWVHAWLLVSGPRVFHSCFVFLLHFFLCVRARCYLACPSVTATFLMKYALRRVLEKNSHATA
jgi:hypothetical protein